MLVGGFVFPVIAAAYYWLPHVTGRVSDLRLSVPAFWLVFVGFNLTFFLIHLTGLLGMPRRVFVYPGNAGWTGLNLLSSVGGLRDDGGLRATGGGPRGAGPLRPALPSRPLGGAEPRMGDADPARLRLRLPPPGRDPRRPGGAAGESYHDFARNGWCETLGVDPGTGAPTEVVVLPRPTFLPLWTGLATLAFVLCLLFKLYALAPVLLLVVVGLFLAWTRITGATEDLGPLPIGLGARTLPHWEAARPPSWWAMALALLADGTLYAARLFGALFLWLMAPDWPGPAVSGPEPASAAVALAGLVLAALAGGEPCGG